MKEENFKNMMDTCFIDVAKQISEMSTCLRRKYGAVIVSKDYKVLSTGYNHNVLFEPCNVTNKCIRRDLGIASGTMYELCKSVHAEMDALLNIENRKELENGYIYIYGYDIKSESEIIGYPCLLCSRIIIKSGLGHIILRDIENNKIIHLTIEDLKQRVDKIEKIMENEILNPCNLDNHNC